MTMPLRGATADAPFAGRKLLQRGLVLVQFSPVLTIADRSGSGIAAFQEELRGDYPNLEMDVEATLQMEMKAGPMPFQPLIKEMPVWRMSDVAKVWRVSLTPESIALEVSGEGYSSSEDFAARMARLVTAVAEHFNPAERQRIGVRFVNGASIGGDDDPRKFCARELVSITGEDSVVYADLTWRFTVDEGELLLRSGVLPAGATYDPRLLDPIANPRWYLDIDVISNKAEPFKAEAMNEAILAQVRRVHAIYRWAMPKPDAKVD